jgi:hypothetical protein
MVINRPAGAIIIVGLQHPGETPQPYAIAEYKTIDGRAGRLPRAYSRSSKLDLDPGKRE